MSLRSASAHRARVVVVGLPILLLTALATSQARAKDYRVSFKGKHVYEEHTGLTALPDEAHEHVFLSSTKHHFWLVLPYSETWVLESGKKLPLDARDGRFDVSVRVEPRGQESDEEFLRKALAELARSEERRTLEATFFDLHDRAILRVKSRGTAAAWAWTYRVAAPRDNRWYVLRLTLEGDEEIEAAIEEQILDILGVGFGADFEID